MPRVSYCEVQLYCISYVKIIPLCSLVDRHVEVIPPQWASAVEQSTLPGLNSSCNLVF